MAAADKIYGTLAQYDEFLAWVKDNNPELIEYFYHRDRLDRDAGDVRPITSLAELADMWLLGHCPIVWVIDRIKEQHNLEYLIAGEVFVHPHPIKYDCPHCGASGESNLRYWGQGVCECPECKCGILGKYMLYGHEGDKL